MLIGIVVLMTIITLALSLHMNILGALLIVIFGFLFVTVSSRLTGKIGSTSNPTSGMTVATLLFTRWVYIPSFWQSLGRLIIRRLRSACGLLEQRCAH